MSSVLLAVEDGWFNHLPSTSYLPKHPALVRHDLNYKILLMQRYSPRVMPVSFLRHDRCVSPVSPTTTSMYTM